MEVIPNFPPILNHHKNTHVIMFIIPKYFVLKEKWTSDLFHLVVSKPRCMETVANPEKKIQFGFLKQKPEQLKQNNNFTVSCKLD